MPIYLTTEAGDRLLTEDVNFLIGERSLPQYEGFNVFDLPINWSENPFQRLVRSMAVLENVTGRPTVRSHTATPVPWQ